MKKSGNVKIEEFVLTDRYEPIKDRFGDDTLVYVGDMLVRPDYIISFTSFSRSSNFEGYIRVCMKNGDSFYISEDSYKNIWEGIDL